MTIDKLARRKGYQLIVIREGGLFCETGARYVLVRAGDKLANPTPFNSDAAIRAFLEQAADVKPA